MLGWHFCRNDKKLGFGDGRQIKTGRTLKVEPPIQLCVKGLHASKRIRDALSYSQGDVLCKVRLGGKVIIDTDKAVATERTVLAMRGAGKMLHEFACICAERALKKAKVKDERCWNAIEVKRNWLKGMATDKELAAAQDAAWFAAWGAARGTAWAAARAAARTAARDAARGAARGAARAAARGAEKKWQNRTLLKMANKIFEATDGKQNNSL